MERGGAGRRCEVDGVIVHARVLIVVARVWSARGRGRRRATTRGIRALADDAPVSRITEIEGELRVRLPVNAP